MVAQVEAQKSRYLDSVLALDPRRSKCAFLVSSNFDLPTEITARLRAQWAGRFWLIPTLTIVGDEAYEDKVELESQEISDWMRLSPDLAVSSSAARKQTFQKALREALDTTSGDIVVMMMCVNFSLGTRAALDQATRGVGARPTSRRALTALGARLMSRHCDPAGDGRPDPGGEGPGLPLRLGPHRGAPGHGHARCGNQSLRAASSWARSMRFDSVSSTRVEGRPRESASIKL